MEYYQLLPAYREYLPSLTPKLTTSLIKGALSAFPSVRG
jgi:hypothetical protein